MKSDPTFWILARASGFAAYALLTAAVLAGLVLKSRPFGTRVRPATVTDLHRFLSLLGLGFLALHGIALVLDRAVEIPVLALLVPGITDYRPLFTGLGVVAAELMVLLVASFSLRRLIGTKNWRRLHYASYATFVAATAHGIGAGTDGGRPWALGIYLGSMAALVAATTWRVLVPPATAKARRTPRADAGTLEERGAPRAAGAEAA